MIIWTGICFLRNGKIVLECHFNLFIFFVLIFVLFIEKQRTRLRKSISVEKKISVTLSFQRMENAKSCKRISLWLSNHLKKCASRNHQGLKKSPRTEVVKFIVGKFYEQHCFLQCIRATDGAHVGIKSINDFINRKGIYTVNCQAAADYNYCFFDVVVK